MEAKEAIKVLISMSNKYAFTLDEKEAVSAAIGVLSFASLAESRIKSQKARRDKNILE